MGDMPTKELQDFIASRRALVWYVKDPRALNEASVVEAVLNYGSWRDFETLIRILGVRKVAEIFRMQMRTGRQRGNYRPEVRHYFTLYFDRYATNA